MLKIIDMIFGCLAVRIFSIFSPVQSDHGVVSSILIIRPGGIGDAVHLLPAIQLLKKRFPDIAIDILAERRNSSVFSLSPLLRSVMNYDVPHEFLSVFRKDYDVVIDTEQWHRLSAVVARLTKAATLIGFATNERSRLFSFPVSYSHDVYEVVSFLRLLEPLGISSPQHIEASWLEVPSAAAARATELLRPLNSGKFVAIFPGASIPERRWGVDRFRTLAQRLTDEGVPVVVIGGMEDAREGEAIVRGLPAALNLAAKTSMLESAAVIDRCAVLVSGDSGILHVGVGLGRPTVSLFGSGIARKWAPRGADHIVIDRHLNCSPCTQFGYTPRCPINARCMAEILPDEVFTATVSLLNLKTPQLPNYLLDIAGRH
jgi:lipopolysaccharide heptosyltransferase II